MSADLIDPTQAPDALIYVIVAAQRPNETHAFNYAARVRNDASALTLSTPAKHVLNLRACKMARCEHCGNEFPIHPDFEDRFICLDCHNYAIA